VVSVDYDDNDDKMVQDFIQETKRMFEKQVYIASAGMTTNSHQVWTYMKWVDAEWERTLLTHC